jgi:uncharacterized membrane protein SirB2
MRSWGVCVAVIVARALYSIGVGNALQQNWYRVVPHLCDFCCLKDELIHDLSR